VLLMVVLYNLQQVKRMLREIKELQQKVPQEPAEKKQDE